MSVAEGVLSPPVGRPLSATERNWLLGLAIAVGLACLCWVVGSMESVERKAKLVWNASETSTRFLAIAHTVVATAFLLTSRRMRAPRGWLWLAGLTVAGVLACLAFSALGGMRAPVAGLLFYGYFLAHEVRDELFFYRVNGDVPADSSEAALRGLWTAPIVVVAAAASFVFAWTAFGFGGPHQIADALASVAPAPRGAIGAAVLLAAVALLVVVARRLSRLDPGGLLGFLRRHRPLFSVFAWLYAVLLVGIFLTGRMYAIVAIHVAIWYVFTIRQLAVRGAPSPRPRPLSWTWVRSTVAGFNAFHLGVLALVVAAAAVRAYAYKNGTEPQALAVLVSKESFPYWTLLHVTWSWVPRG